MKYLFKHIKFLGLIAASVSLWVFGDISTAGAAQKAVVSWLPSPSTNAIGYHIYYGVSSGNYTNFISVGNVTNIVVSGLNDGTTYYFAGRSVDGSGAESGLSPEVIYTVPSAAASLQTPAAALNNGISFTVNGISGYSYVVEVSSNLLDWFPVQTNVAPFTFQDSSSSQPGQKFYRSVYYP